MFRKAFFDFNGVKAIFLCCLLSPGVVFAVDFTLRAGVDIQSFDYKEFDDDDVFLDGESGTLPGLALDFEWNWPDWYMELNTRTHAGLLDYDGHTQDGVPAQTESDAFITDALYSVGKKFTAHPSNYMALYGGLGYHYWYRNIRDGYDTTGRPISGLTEYYTWFYAALGAKLPFFNTRSAGMGLNLQARYLFAGSMDVTVPGFDSSTVNLGSDFAYKVSLPIQFYFNQQSGLTILPYYETWNIGKSNTVPLTRGGAQTGFAIHEPRSETRNLGITIQYSHIF